MPAVLSPAQGNMPDTLPVMGSDDFRSDTLLMRLETGELLTGYYQACAFDDEPGTWHLTGRDAWRVEPAEITWWAYAQDVAAMIQVEGAGN
jgi:hypothetical protein